MRLRYWLFLGIVFCPAVNSALSAQTGQSESSAEERLARAFSNRFRHATSAPRGQRLNRPYRNCPATLGYLISWA